MPTRRLSTFVGPQSHPGPARAGTRAALAAGFFCLTAAPAFPGGLFELLFHHDVQVITTTDTTPAGKLRRPVSPSEPIYYVAINAGYHDFGAPMAGDKLPGAPEMVRTIVKVLAQDGFLPADASHPPTQVIMFTWGTLYPDVMPNMWNPDLPDIQLNRRQAIRFLGGAKLGLVSQGPDQLEETLYPGLTLFNPDAQAIADVSRSGLYVVALAGYEFPVEQPKHPKQLWQTRISCPAAGLVMADTMPTMVAIAAPHIGNETRRPVWVNASDKFKPEVRVGNPKFEEFLDSGQLPIFEKEPAPAKTERRPK